MTTTTSIIECAEDAPQLAAHADDAISNHVLGAVTLTNWIPTSVQLPEPREVCLCCYDGCVTIGSYDSELWLSAEFGEATPDYWMTLPPAP